MGFLRTCNGRFIFHHPEGQKLGTVAGETVPDYSERGRERRPETIEDRRERVMQETREKQERLKDQTGEAKDFIEVFRDPKTLDAFFRLMGYGIIAEGGLSRFNFGTWLQLPSDEVAGIFELEFSPHGNGRNAFVAGLKLKNPSNPEDRRKAEESRKALEEIIKLLRQASEKMDADEKENSNGEAKDYVETFTRPDQFNVVTGYLEVMMRIEGQKSIYNFENWIVEDGNKLAEIFIPPYFPQGKGKNAFLEGLRIRKSENLPALEAQKWKESDAALKEIVQRLRKFFEDKTKAKADVSGQAGKIGMGADTVSGWGRTLMKNFNRGSGAEKLLIAGALLAVIGVAWHYRNSEMVKGIKWSDAAKFAGVLWGLNYLSGKVSKDGKTVIQRLDLGLDIENLEDSPIKGFAYEHGMDRDQEKLRTFTLLQNVSIRTLFNLYLDAARPDVSQKEIDPKKLGFHRGEISGRAAYEIMEDLIKETSANMRFLEYNKSRQDQGLEPLREMPDKDSELYKEWTGTPSRNIESFRDKYITGTLSRTNPRLTDAVMYEFEHRNWQKAVAEGKASRLLPRAKEYAVETGKDVYERYVKKYGPKIGDWFRVKGGKAIKLGKDYVATPVAEFFKAKYEKYGHYVADPIKEAVAWWQQVDINEVLPEEFAIDVTAKAPMMAEKPRGRVTIMGYPGIDFDIDDDGGRDKVIMGKEALGTDMEFFISDGEAGNKTKADQLEALIKGKVQALFDATANTTPALQGKQINWDEKEKQWVVEGGVDAGADAWLGLPAKTVDVAFTIDSSKKLHFFTGKKEIHDFKQIDTAYRDSVIQEQVWSYKEQGWQQEYLRGMPVKIEKVDQDTTFGGIITGTIGGLEFHAVPKKNKKISEGIAFYDVSSGKTGDTSLLKIQANPEGERFLSTLTSTILRSEEYSQPFFDLEKAIADASDSVLQRIGEAWKTKGLSGLFNGKLWQKKWAATVEFKKWETLSIFENMLADGTKTVRDIGDTYKEYITPALKAAQELEYYISTLSNDEARADRFEQLLTGEEDRTKVPVVPAGIECLNYGNKRYREMFRSFKAMISEEGFDYVTGPDGVDYWQSYEVYQILLHVWSFNTRQFANGEGDSAKGKPLKRKPGTPVTATTPTLTDPKSELTEGAEDEIERVNQKIRHWLQVAKGKSGGIKKENLPLAITVDDLMAWLGKGNWPK